MEADGGKGGSGGPAVGGGEEPRDPQGQDSTEGYALRVFVSGRVQGVFFRAFTKEEANRLGVCGWVRNLSDGRVEAHIEHRDRGVLDTMLARLKAGPPGSHVNEVEIIGEMWEGYGRFEIRAGW